MSNVELKWSTENTPFQMHVVYVITTTTVKILDAQLIKMWDEKMEKETRWSK